MKVDKENYKRAILKVVADSPQPVDVENIRASCRISNWETALRHCLELLLDGKIRGIKTTKSWIFWSKPLRPLVSN